MIEIDVDPPLESRVSVDIHLLEAHSERCGDKSNIFFQLGNIAITSIAIKVPTALINNFGTSNTTIESKHVLPDILQEIAALGTSELMQFSQNCNYFEKYVGIKALHMVCSIKIEFD